MGRGHDHGRHGGPDQFLPQRMEAWRPRLILLLAQFEFRTATTLLCAAIVSFRSLNPRFIPAISGGAADRTHAGVTRPLNSSIMFVFRRAPPLAIVRRVSSSADDSNAERPFRAEPFPLGRAGLRPLALPLAPFVAAIRNVRCTSIRDVARTSQMRKLRTFLDRPANGPNRTRRRPS